MPPKGNADFISSTWEMVNAGHPEVGWTDNGTFIIVTNAERLAEHILPQYFKHGQYASWVRALNAYDFRKSGAGRWQHPSFVRGRPELLANIRRKLPPSRGMGRGGGARPSASSTATTSTALVPHPRRAPTGPQDEAAQQLWWMQQELTRLEGEVGALKAEEFQQRFDTVRLMQVMLAQLAHTAHGAGGATTIRINPAVLPARDCPKLTCKNPEAVDGAADMLVVEDEEGEGRSGQGAVSPRSASSFVLPPLQSQHSDDAGLLPSLHALGRGSPPVLESVPSLRLDEEGLPSSPGLSPLASSSSPGPSSFAPLHVPPTGASFAMPHGLDARPAKLHVDSPAMVMEEGGLLRLAEGAGGSIESPLSPPDDGIERLSTSRAVFAATPTTAAGETLPASLVNALASSAASSTAQQFLGVLARMPPLPASTDALPPPGTLQRQHIEAAIELAFRQLTLTANAATMASAQAQEAGS